MRIFDVFTVLVTFATLCRAHLSTECLQDYGTYPVNWNDNVLMFYVTVKNDGDVRTTASVKMIECCEQLSAGDKTACNHMRLDGSRTKLEKHTVANCTLCYPNAYPYNRKGTCNVNITLSNNRNETVEFLRNITFDTTVRSEDILRLLRENVLSSLNVRGDFRLCELPDEDPFDLCEPVNCHMKYRGFRSFFDAVKRQCVPIPVCDGGTNTNSPDVAYDPFSNSCTEMTRNNISIDDIDCILHGTQDDVLRVKTKTEHSYRTNVRCHHGEMDETNRSCVCNDGWKSSVDFGIPVVSTVPVHVCTIKTPRQSFYMCPSALDTLGSKNIVSFAH